MQPKGSSPHSHEPSTYPFSEPDRSSSCPRQSNLISILTLSFHLRLGFPSGLLLSSFPTKTLYAPLLSLIRDTCPAHFNLLDSITRSLVRSTEHKAPCYVVFSTPRYLVPLRPNYSPQLPILEKLSLHSPLSVSDRVSQPYKTTGKFRHRMIATFPDVSNMLRNFKLKF